MEKGKKGKKRNVDFNHEIKWMKATKTELLAKAELGISPATPAIQHQFTILLGLSEVTINL